MATFPIKVEKPEMKIMGLNILPMVVKVNKMMPEGMRKKAVVKQVSTYYFFAIISAQYGRSQSEKK